MELGFGSHRGRTSGCEERLAEELPRRFLPEFNLKYRDSGLLGATIKCADWSGRDGATPVFLSKW
jgi:hypothetical protein